MSSQISMKEQASSIPQSIYNWLARQLGDQKPKGTIAVLDGVRAIACIMVVFYHSNTYWWVVNQISFMPVPHLFGAQGVTLFFLLSGFLLFLPYIQALLFGKRWPQARVFYMRRILRIVPGYYFLLFITVLLSQPAYSAPQSWTNFFLFLTFLMPKQLAFSMNAVLWTLAVEFQYYLLLPLIALGILGLTRLVPRSRRVWVVIAALCGMAVWGVGTRFWGEMLFARPDYHAYLASRPLLKIFAFLTYGNSPVDSGKYLEDFAVGMLLAVCYTLVTNTTRGETYRRILQRFSPWLWFLGLALLACTAARNCTTITWCAGAVPITTFAAYPVWGIEFAFAVGFGLCMLAILFDSGWLKRFFEWTPLRWVGLISFSLYLWQFVFISFFDAGFTPYLTAHFSRPVVLIVFTIAEWTVMLSGSFALYVLIERPGMHLSERLRKKMLARDARRASLPPIQTETPGKMVSTRAQSELVLTETPDETAQVRTENDAFSDELTEPRQPAILTETPRH